ncbi:MAG: MBL fold metallo-hydrolase [Oscillospiraceae bacterium]|nr:MBL fold metallo-hydrolase [Candidatus Equicaccousia limihippi]
MPKICPAFSSSSGNCVYIAYRDKVYVIDCGVSYTRMVKALSENGIQKEQIQAVFVTHTHSDHIGGLNTLVKKINVPIIGTKKTVDKLCDRLPPCRLVLADEFSFDDQNIKVQSFATSHDCPGSCGYVFEIGEHKIGICTDLGVVTDEVKNALTGCDVLYFESNHDITMLERGVYPPELKRRILGNGGHLSNNACAFALKHFVQNGTRFIILGHLSKENNLPHLAQSATVAALMEIGAKEGEDYTLYVAPEMGGQEFSF